MSEENKETEIEDKVPDSTLDEQVGETIHETEEGKKETDEWKKILEEMEAKRNQDWQAFLDQRKAEREELLNRLNAVEEDQRNWKENMKNLQLKPETMETTETPEEKLEKEIPEVEQKTTEQKPENHTKRKRRTIF